LCSRRIRSRQTAPKKKSGSKLPHSIHIFIQEYCITKITTVKKKFAEKFTEKAPEINPRET
jgi:hypothetical protein